MFFDYELTESERDAAENPPTKSSIWPQLALNEKSKKNYELLEIYFDNELRQWSEFLTADDQACFDIAINSWQAYREAEATFAAGQYEGGTIAPMVYWLKAAELTKSKLESLENERATLRKM
ncbi:lysozyme inhibitor LprI family protein [Sphingomicrobium astaxanthinifaciens]|uniref:lysozyme inhibitor LprI family protein n=1 Tax=Sphingomicrobium astaxanthinifaciens TaxID=1227949 RepID=UPI001FCB707E|nr:lysozyme inhibitor LprI family protein [Sphingomicrobium astaxanthinifaciens]MCJ7421470.1 lysozyme inhibitor LprI family protein [Sphingomicrobium astaxanthinifaciens]